MCNITVTESHKGPVALNMACFLAGYNDTKANRKLFSVLLILLSITGIALNLYIIIRYISKRQVQIKTSNTLLAHQALVDGVNIFCYIAPAIFFLMKPTGSPSSAATIMFTLYHISAYSSLFSFAMVALERWLAIWRPIWHRQHVTRSNILHCVIVVWVTTIAVTVDYAITASLKKSTKRFRMYAMLVFVLFILIISVLFLMSYIRARVTVMAQNQESIRKDLKLAVVFSLMYFIFLCVTATITINITFPSTKTTYVQLFAFVVSSTLNPIITILLRQDFKILIICANNARVSPNNNGENNHQ